MLLHCTAPLMERMMWCRPRSVVSDNIGGVMFGVAGMVRHGGRRIYTCQGMHSTFSARS